MCKILANFTAWYPGEVAPGYNEIFSLWQFTASSILFTTVHALEAIYLEKDVRGVLAYSCVLIDRNSRKFVRPFRSFGKMFSGSLSFTNKTIPGELFNEL